jgi:hypothetical protein
LALPRDRDLERIFVSELLLFSLAEEELELELDLEVPAFLSFSLFLMSLFICHISLSKL